MALWLFLRQTSNIRIVIMVLLVENTGVRPSKQIPHLEVSGHGGQNEIGKW